MLASFRFLALCLLSCSCLIPAVSLAEPGLSNIFDYLANGAIRQEFLTLNSKDTSSRFLSCGKIFITAVSCEGAARLPFEQNGQVGMPESLGARVWFGNQVIATVPLARTGRVDQGDPTSHAFTGMQGFPNPIFLNTSGVNCNNRVTSKASIRVESTTLLATYRAVIECNVSFYRM